MTVKKSDRAEQGVRAEQQGVVKQARRVGPLIGARRAGYVSLASGGRKRSIMQGS